MYDKITNTYRTNYYEVINIPKNEKSKRKYKKITVKAEILEPEEKVEKLVADTKDYFTFIDDRLKDQKSAVGRMIDRTREQRMLFGIM